MRRGVPLPLLRAFALAAVAVIASTYALVRYYTHPRLPMRVTVSAAIDGGAPGEIPAPDLDDAGP